MNDDIDTSPLTEAELAEAKRYPMVVEWSDEDDAYIVSVPDLQGVRTHGATREEALEMGAEAAAVWISAMRSLGRPIPPPSIDAGNVLVERPATPDAARIKQIRRDMEVSQRAFAALLNVSVGTVRAWEQGVRVPDGASLRLLAIAAQRPDAILGIASMRPKPRALGDFDPEPTPAANRPGGERGHTQAA
jgi:DNA-binding transcriptional regulator YiaG/predicted RNase H-like HicB family nuclease